MSEHHLYAVPLMATRGNQIPLELKSACCKRPREYWESNQGPLEEQPVFLTATISQPHILCFTSVFFFLWQNFDSSFQAWSLVMNFMFCVSLCTKLEVPFVVYFLNQREFVCPFFSSPWGKILHSPDCPQTRSWSPCLFLASSGTTIMCLHAWLILTLM